MINSDIKKSLIKSAIFLLTSIVLVSFVVSAQAVGFWASIGAIFSGIFSTLIFVIGLSIALLISVVIIIAIFFGTIALHSVEKAKDMFNQFKLFLLGQSGSLKDLLGKFNISCGHNQIDLTAKITKLEKEIEELKASQYRLEKHLDKLNSDLITPDALSE